MVSCSLNQISKISAASACDCVHGCGCGGSTLPDAEAVDSRLLGNHCYNQVEMLKGGCSLSEFGIMEREREEKEIRCGF